MNPSDVLDKVASIIAERAQTHGDYRDTFQMTADIWSAYLGTPITPVQVCVLNALQKLARDQNSEDCNPDNLDDGTGYLAIGAAIQQAKNEKTKM